MNRPPVLWHTDRVLRCGAFVEHALPPAGPSSSRALLVNLIDLEQQTSARKATRRKAVISSPRSKRPAYPAGTAGSPFRQNGPTRSNAVGPPCRGGPAGPLPVITPPPCQRHDIRKPRPKGGVCVTPAFPPCQRYGIRTSITPTTNPGPTARSIALSPLETGRFAPGCRIRHRWCQGLHAPHGGATTDCCRL